MFMFTSNKKDDWDIAQNIPRTYKELREKYVEKVKSHEESMDSLRNTYDKRLRDLQRDLDRVQEEHDAEKSNKNTKLKTQHQEEVARLKEEHATVVEELKSLHREAVQQIKDNYEKETAQLKGEHTALSIEKEKYAAENTVLRDAFESMGLDVADTKEMMEKMVDGLSKAAVRSDQAVTIHNNDK